MPDVASILKKEMARVARKEVRAATQVLKKSVASHRVEISALKRQARLLDQELRRLRKAQAKTRTVKADEAPAKSVRFSAKGLASQRRRLGLSVSDCGLLLGTSGQSIYNWESGKVRPQPAHLMAIAALRTLGKRAVTARLASLRKTS